MQGFIAELIEAGSVEFSEKPYMKILVSGCDYRCLWCNNPDLIETKLEHEIDLRQVKKQIEFEKENIEGVLITGGEPTFQKQALLELTSKIKEQKLKVAISTNGSKSNVIEKLLKEELVDTIIIDFKAPLNNLYDKVTNSSTFFKSAKSIIEDYKDTLQILKNYDDKIEIIFSTTIIPSLMFKKEDLLLIAKEIQEINAEWKLKRYSKAGVKDKILRELESPGTNFLETLKETIIKEYPQIKVDIQE